MKCEVVHITPAIAKRYLKYNKGNRILKDWHVFKLAEAMRRGTFVVNGDPIRFNGTNLIDGQHRLSAIVKSGQSYDMVVVRGLPSEAFQAIDRGIKRTTADTLFTLGEKNATLAGSLVGKVLDYLFRGNATSRRWSTIVSDFEKAAFLEQYPLSREAVRVAAHHARDLKGILPPSSFALLAYLSTFTVAIDWEEYWGRIATGNDLPDKSGAKLFRKVICNNFNSNKKLSDTSLIAYGITAFNKDVDRCAVSVLRISTEFPVMVNVPNNELVAFFRLEQLMEKPDES